ncbi:MAG: shikimate dehydrogenase [Candidatus Omnitrophica bacterium]|nr:shikimate dehydrogenase [Candidatus Omnitrophota bacterium]
MKPQVKSLTFGLLGYPIKHSLSPSMHNAGLRSLKIKARYKLFEVNFEKLAEFFLNIKKKNIRAFNVTIPYKEKVIPYLNSLSVGAQEIGAVNTVVVSRNGKLKGFNTDYLGFAGHLKELKVKPYRVAIIGAGGAAKAVCFALAKMKVLELCIYDIDKFKSLSLFKRLSSNFAHTRFDVATRIEDLKIGQKDLLINATPVGMHSGDPCLINESWLHKGLFVYDLIYDPAETKLISLARKYGLNCSNGLGMLLYQGVFAFKYFTGKKPPVKIMQEALIKGAQKI